jgi:hypothetical protein
VRGRADAHRLLVAAGGAAEEPGFEGGGAEQTAGDAGGDQRDVAGAEDAGDEGEAREEIGVRSVLLEGVGEVPAVGDERAEEAEDLADASRLGPIGIGLGRRGQCSSGGCHERNKNTGGGCWARKKSWEGGTFSETSASGSEWAEAGGGGPWLAAKFRRTRAPIDLIGRAAHSDLPDGVHRALTAPSRLREGCSRL